MSSATMTFDRRWRLASARYADNVFLTFLDADGSTDTWTYAEFDHIIAGTAVALRGLGVEPGAAVHVALRNCPAFVAIWLAATRLGATLVPVDPASAARDLHTQITRVRPVVGFCARGRAQVYRASASQPQHVVELSETAEDIHPGAGLIMADQQESLQEEPPYLPRPEDRLAVMFTSGTTSQPKGVVLTQHNYAYVADSMSRAIDLRARHRWLVALPLFHANAQYYCFAPAIAVGASVALVAGFSASRWLEHAQALGVTHASLFAAPIRMILARSPEPRPTLHLEHVWFAQSLGPEHYEQFARLAGVRPRQLYGMTETVAIVTADMSNPARPDTIGSPVPGRQLALVDPVTGIPVEPQTPGVAVIGGTRGETLFAEYLDDPDITNHCFEHRDGLDWFTTGDIICENARGTYDFVGRADDVIKVAGENVSLSEVESVLAQAPGVLEVAVVSQPDPIRDHVPIAYFVPRDSSEIPTSANLDSWAAEHLAPQARPRAWHAIDELPRTSVGKVRRFAVSSQRRAAAEPTR